MSEEQFELEDGESLSSRRPVISDETISMIARMPEFHFLSRAEVANLAKLEPQIFKRGETIIHHAETNARILVVLLAGECRIEKSVFVNGKELWINIENIHAPAMVGEVGVFSSIPRTARVVSCNRSAALLLTAKTLREHFDRSKATLPQMLWSFARLGLLRAIAGAEQYAKLYKKNVDCKISEPPGFEKEIERLQDEIGDEPNSANVTEKTFDSVGGLLDRVDHALALAKFFDTMEDCAMPEKVEGLDRIAGSLTALAEQAIRKNDSHGGSIKETVTKLCAKQQESCSNTGDWVTCLEGMIMATNDLLRLAQADREKNFNRKIEPGTEAMMRGFEERIKSELDDLYKKAVERFGAETLPEKLGDDRESNLIEAFLRLNLEKIEARTSVSDFETDVFGEYFRPGQEMRETVAMGLYNGLGQHPIIRLLVPGTCHHNDSPSQPSSLLGFLCFGYYLLYPVEKADAENMEKYPPPYPV